MKYDHQIIAFDGLQMKQYVQQTIKLGTASVLGVVVAIQMGCSSATSKQSEEITVYTAVEADQLKQYQEELHKAYPELKSKMGT